MSGGESPQRIVQTEVKLQKPVDNNLEPEQFRKVFIGGINYRTNEETLHKHFSKYGEIIDCVVMRDPRSKRTRGFGFVAFTNSMSVDSVQRDRPHVIGGKQVETKRAMPREDADKPDSHVTTKKLYVGGVKNPELTEEMLKEYFTQFGDMESLDIITDNNTGNRRGFAFVKFYDYDSVDKAAQIKNHMVGGFKLETTKALSRQERQFANDKMKGQYANARNGGEYRAKRYDTYEGYPQGQEYRGNYPKYPKSDRDYYRYGRERYMPYGPPPQQHVGNYYLECDPGAYYQQQYRERWDDQAPAYNRPWPDPRGPAGQYPAYHPYPRDAAYRSWPSQYPTNPLGPPMKDSNHPSSPNANFGYADNDTRGNRRSQYDNLMQNDPNQQPSIHSYGDGVNSYMHDNSSVPSDPKTGDERSVPQNYGYSSSTYRQY